MKNFVIVTDSCSDLSKDYIQKNHIGILPLSFQMGEDLYEEEQENRAKEFYNRMRSGFVPVEVETDMDYIQRVFSGYLEQGLDIIYIGYSFLLKNQNAKFLNMIEDLREVYPLSKIAIIDSTSISLGLGILIHMSTVMKRNGKVMDEIMEWVEEYKKKVRVSLIIDDIRYLNRFRHKKISLILERMIKVKPILRILEDGSIGFVKSVRGRRRSMVELFRLMEREMQSQILEKNKICIVHADALDDAKILGALIAKKYPEVSITMSDLTPVIGAFTGPGTICLCYLVQ